MHVLYTQLHITQIALMNWHTYIRIVLTVDDAASIDCMPCNCVEEDAGIG